jgi:hypothetical protein
MGEPYQYELPDKLEVDNKAPAGIKITKLPKNGTMKFIHNGEERIVMEGDVVSHEQMSSFTYDIETDECTIESQENCQDTFSYVPLSSW